MAISGLAVGCSLPRPVLSQNLRNTRAARTQEGSNHLGERGSARPQAGWRLIPPDYPTVATVRNLRASQRRPCEHSGARAGPYTQDPEPRHMDNSSSAGLLLASRIALPGESREISQLCRSLHHRAVMSQTTPVRLVPVVLRSPPSPLPLRVQRGGPRVQGPSER